MRLSSEGAAASYPRVVAAKVNSVVLWTETVGQASRLRMLLLK